MSETELKFVLDDAATRRLRTRLKALGRAGAPPQTRSLRSIYYDTPDHRLAGSGTALRLRRDGKRWLQTVKSRASLSGGLSRVEEVEVPAPGGRISLEAIPSEPLRIELEALLNGAQLVPVCETAMRRTTSLLTATGGGSAELAIDVGEIRAGDTVAPFREAELELLEGDLGTLYDLTAQLFPEGGLHFSTLSKAARGYKLAEDGHIGAVGAPRKLKPVALAPDQTSETAARDVLRECFEQIAANVVVTLSSEAPEGPHQLRVGLRRLRAAFTLFRPVIGSGEMDRLAAEARWLGQEVGTLRDLDVVITDLITPEIAAGSDATGFEALRDAVAGQREVVRADLRATLSGPRAQGFQIALARFIETRAWLDPTDFGQTGRLAAPVLKTADIALSKRWKKVSKKAKRIETLDVEARHALRKELKKLRYSVEFFSGLYPKKKVAAFVKTMKRLQEVFGSLNDLAMAEAMLSRPGAPGADSAEAQRAVGWILGRRSLAAEEDWSHAKELWSALKARGPYWSAG